MARPRISLERAAIGLLMVNVATVGVIVSCLLTARRASEHGENALVALADDVTRASQAQAAAERMIAVGRGYLLTHEPELLVRAQAAEVKLTRTLRTIVSTTDEAEERQRLDPVMAFAKRYRDTFAVLLSGEKAPREPREVAESMRKQLIPARDDLVAGLDELVARRLGQLESLRSSARDLRSTTLDVMLGLGGLGVVASMLFAWLVATRARELGSQRFEPGVVQIRPPDGARVPGPHRLSRRPPSARSRPS
jgi:hypothetical protein